MASIRTFHLPHYDAYPVHVALFEDVENAEFLKSQLLAANPEFDYAFLDATMILTHSHLLTSTFLTLHSFSAPTTSPPKTKTPHSELVFRLSPNNNIAQAYKLFGIGEATRSVVVVKIGGGFGAGADDAKPSPITAQSVSEHLGRVVQGRSVVISEQGVELGQYADVDRICKVYKIGGVGGGGGGGGGGMSKGGKGVNGSVVDVEEKEKERRKELESVILGIMSLKGS
ncbi:hypothetical protein J1614_010844 [Plenodomus biglobosus]|nr:hypothetical protein J1614_010844 [Plenodomus biglobosus]